MIQIQEIFREMDEHKSHAFTLDRFKALLQFFGEVVQIIKRFDGKLDGQV